jgi:hypothetical protein
MSQDKVVTTEIEIARRNWMADHERSYLRSGGSEGHIVDLTAIGGQAFSGTWREPEGAERDAIWAFMEEVYPPYTEYQQATQRTIPLVMLSPRKSIEVFHE